jgi:hypothetical protein
MTAGGVVTAAGALEHEVIWTVVRTLQCLRGPLGRAAAVLSNFPLLPPGYPVYINGPYRLLSDQCAQIPTYVLQPERGTHCFSPLLEIFPQALNLNPKTPKPP